MANPPRAIFLNQDPGQIDVVFADDRQERISAMLPLRPGVVRREDLADLAAELNQIEIVFSTWGMPCLDERELALLPRLKAVFYAAGSVKGFAPPLLARGIQVSSAWRANALPVAEYALAQILLALKQTYHHARAVRTARTWDPAGRLPVTGAYGATVGLIGLGAIGRRMVELLRTFDLRVIAFDPYAPPPPGVEMVGLDEIFQRAAVVSLHAPLIPANVGMIHGRHLRSLPPYATFINTARGPLVREGELIDVLRERPDLQAVLDVCEPEPPTTGNPLHDLPNVLLTPHISGSMGNELLRMSDWMIEECGRFLRGEQPRHAIDQALLATMA